MASAPRAIVGTPEHETSEEHTVPRKKIDITLPDLTGKRALITGASDGMGLIMARRLAAAGAEVIVPVRNRTKGENALATIRATFPDAAVSLRDLDLSSLESVARLGETLRAEGEPIHLLINNAGVMSRGLLFGPMGPGRVGGTPGEQPLFRPLRSMNEAARMWECSEELTQVKLPTA
ncbi:hypothetical protein MIC448_2020005 [Microbacterium sp. C448]|uniref:SDR family NAD(P)-dependent oxidoreductase n=1 Tax=Microbacterium sp. C448 TaxID=1177594 RepID=UPI0003DE59C0|nr:SDR family NAD(P)-dependent oxidoreductase [Microbacterium sp. C448]CDK00003.1 hypothetical protein MIC448_2020005 [Microbacterium sp. C448]